MALEKLTFFRIAAFVLSAVLFFHSNFLLFGCFVFALVVWAVLFERSRKRQLGLVFSVLPVVILTLPWLLYAKSFDLSSNVLNKCFTGRFFVLIGWYVRGVDSFGLLPLLMLMLLPFSLICRQNGKIVLRRDVLMLLVICAGYLFALCIVSPQSVQGTEVADMRYVAPLIGPLIALTAAVCVEVYRWRRWIGVVLIVLVVLTDLPRFSGIKIGLKTPFHRCCCKVQRYVMLDLVSYVDSLCHPYQGAYEKVNDLLNKEADDDDLVWCIPHSATSPLIFHTGLRFANRFHGPTRISRDDLGMQRRHAKNAGLPEYLFESKEIPDWVVVFEGTGSFSITDPSGAYVRYESQVIEAAPSALARSDLSHHSFVSESKCAHTQKILVCRRTVGEFATDEH